MASPVRLPFIRLPAGLSRAEAALAAVVALTGAAAAVGAFWLAAGNEPPAGASAIAVAIPAVKPPPPAEAEATSPAVVAGASPVAALPPAKLSSASAAASTPALGQSRPVDGPSLAKRASAGDPDAQYALGVAYAEGRGVKRDLGRAAAWYREAAINGVADAQYRLGLLCRDGQGVAPDVAEALFWLHAAAERRHADAQYALGRLYRDGGPGVSADAVAAARWLRRAAEQGHAAAELAYAELFERGSGVARSPVEAYAWALRAAAAGQSGARAYAERLNASLAPEEHAEGAARAGQPLALPDDPSAPRALVSEIQRLLAALDYDPGPPDGVPGERTGQAIRLFQEKAGLPADGRADEILLNRLRAAVTPPPPVPASR